jgi:hypothetical protein
MAPSLEEWVADLASGHDARLTKAAVRQSAHGKGLFASEPVKRGDVVASVPKKLTLWVQEGNALALPGDGAWPRVRAGASAAAPDSGKGWEFILARAIVDAVAGDGGAFWEAYGGMMPGPETLAHPFLLSDAALRELQDDDMARRARDERELIKALMPDLTTPQHAMDDDPHVTVGAWALALVRSRAMRVGVDAHAVVPFLDCANHASVPSVDYRCDSVETPASSGLPPQASEATADVELVALTDADVGDELRLAYTKGRLTSTEHFEQSGFVPAGGSPADRVRGLPAVPRGRRAARLGRALRRAIGETLRGVWSEVEALESARCGSGGDALDARAVVVAAGASIAATLGDGDDARGGESEEGGEDTTSSEDMTREEESAHLEALRRALADVEASFATTLEADEAAFGGARERGDERSTNMMHLRVCRKRLARRVREVLDGIELEES